MRRYASHPYLVAALLVLAASLVAVAPPIGSPAGASAGSTAEERSHEAAFVARINDLRLSRGLGPVASDPELTALARRWTDTMAAGGGLRHASDLSVGIPPGWTVLGENVGVHTVHDVDRLFQAFIDSPSHLANLTDARYNRVGVGVVHAPDGRIWTTHRFMATPAALPPPAAPAASPPPPPPPATAPPTTPPTTAPPTTARPTTAPPITAPPTTDPPITAAPTTGPPTTRPLSTTATPTTATPLPPPPTAPRSVPQGAPALGEVAAGQATADQSFSEQPSDWEGLAAPRPSPSATTGLQSTASPPRSARSTEAAIGVVEPVVARLAEILTEVDASGL
ncbi:MAG: CAP domain-containing protein [Acidimicrobiales bacterium]